MKYNSEIEISFISKKYPKLYRLFTAIPWAFAIIILSICIIWYSIFLIWYNNNNKTVLFIICIIILLYYIWWIIRWFEYVMFTIISVFNIFKYSKINFNKILFKKSELNKEESLFNEKLSKDLDANEIIHRFIIPTYKESENILSETIEALKDSNYDISKYAVTIAWEEWDIENFTKIAKNLTKKYFDFFTYFNYTIHPKWVKWEVIWKWWNIKFSAKQEFEKILKKFNTTPDKVLLTTLDADTCIDKTYPSILTYTYINTKDRKHKSYQPMVFFFNNFWDVPFFSKLVSLFNSFWIMFNSMKSLWMKNFSTHAQPLDALIELNFWSCETIVEDWHQYRRSYFGFNWNYSCVPIFTRVYQDANLNKSIYLTAKAVYTQMRRWSHGWEDVPYILAQWINNFKKMNFFRTLYEFVRHLESILLWSTLHIVLMTWFTFTFIRDISLSSYISLGTAISVFLKMSLLMLLLIWPLQLISCPFYKIKSFRMKIWEVVKLIISYIFFAWVTFMFLSWIPALHTQIALMFWRPMKKFNVTEKIRKEDL